MTAPTYNLSFIDIDIPKTLRDFIVHIKELVTVSLAKGDTYNDLFRKLEEKFKDDTPEKKAAVKEWIDFQKNGDIELSQFDAVIVKVDGLVAHFDMHKL